MGIPMRGSDPWLLRRTSGVNGFLELVFVSNSSIDLECNRCCGFGGGDEVVGDEADLTRGDPPCGIFQACFDDCGEIVGKMYVPSAAFRG